MAQTECKSPPSGNKRETQKRETRLRMLNTALEMFASRGFEGSSLRDIASAANVNHGMIKYHFENKDQLWRAAVTMLFDRMDAELGGDHAEDRDADPLTQTKNAIRRYVRYCARHPEHARIMIQESIRDNERLDWAVDTFIRPQHRALGLNRARSENKGTWPNIPEASLAFIVAASSQLPFVLAPELQRIYGIDIMTPENVERHADAMLELFFSHSA